tara:strand:- start:210 stop:716 length:507 start_codon:yes stop_codon:yes gene_type:complete
MVQDSKHSGTNPGPNGKRDLLVNQVNWPTPAARDHKGHTITPNHPQGFNTSLPNAVLQAKDQKWPTPTTQDANKATKKLRDNHQNNLTAVVFNETLPTPTARDWKGGYTEASLTRKDGKSRRFDGLPNAARGGVGTDIIKGHLSPDWVEGLMGLSLGSTALGSWEFQE